MAKVKSEYYPPVFQGKAFNCIHCNVFSSQKWHQAFMPWAGVDVGALFGDGMQKIPIYACVCLHCSKMSYWHEENGGKMIFPSETPIEPPHADLPLDCRIDYEEARNIFSPSPRGAAALLRLCVQKLCVLLGETGDNLNEDIKSLVSKGLPGLVQKALDYCRVIGNHAVHPGVIDIKDTPEIAQNLFKMINFVVEERITRPKEIQEAFDKLPKGAKKHIEKRDKKKR